MFLNKKINYIYIYSRIEIFLMLKLKKNNVVGIFKNGMNDSIADKKKHQDNDRFLLIFVLNNG